MRADNPFSHSIVTDPWQPAESDVPAIHAAAFDRCCEALQLVRQTGRSQSVLLYGEAGSGKTHLLARLRTHRTDVLSAEAAGAPPRVVFTAVRLRAGARMICRHLRRTLADDLLRRSGYGLTQLDHVLLHRFAPLLKLNGASALRWWQWLQQPAYAAKAERKLDRLLDQLDEQAGLGRNLCTVLRCWALGRSRRDARDWLRDGTLPDSSLRRLGLTAAGDDEDPEVEALELVCALSRLCGSEIPLALCFDQIEALQTHPQDMAGLFAFGQMIGALHDKTTNVLLVSCVQTSFAEVLNRAVRDADRDRLTRTTGLLERLTWEQAEALVAARLRTWPGAASLRRVVTDRIWPLSAETLQRFAASRASGRCTPRELIAFCEDEFEKWRRGAAGPVPTTAEFLASRYEHEFERAQAAGAPERSDDTLAHGLPLVLDVLERGKLSADPLPRDVDLILLGPRGPTHVSYCNQPGGKLTARLRRLREQVELSGLTNLVLIRDARLPISKQAKKAREHLDALQQRGSRLIRPAVDALAALEALRAVLSDAKAGDLANHGQAVAPATVRQWLAANLAPDLRELVEQLTPDTDAVPRDGLYDDLLELIQQRHLLRVAEASQTLNRAAAEIETCLQRHPDQFAVLQGPPAVIFELVPDPAPG